MGKEVDERILSMKFDNSNFEKNMSTTMGTLDKFNNKLKFDGASQGLQNINLWVWLIQYLMGLLSP